MRRVRVGQATVSRDCAAGLEVCRVSRVKAITGLSEGGAGNFFEKVAMEATHTIASAAALLARRHCARVIRRFRAAGYPADSSHPVPVS